MGSNFKVGFIISIIAVLILIGSVVYIWNTKTQEIDSLNTQVTSLNSEIQLKTQEIIKLDESFKLVKFSCLFNLRCKEDYNERLRQRFLESNNLEDAQYQYVGTGQNYYKYFLESGNSIDLPLKLREFIENNCPDGMYKTPGKLFSRYVYDINGNELSIVMDEETVEIICSWVYNVSSDFYS